MSIICSCICRISKILSSIYSKAGNAYLIGITGPPGAGKSTIVDKLSSYLVKDGNEVGIIAVDPSSPFTGGALLGDGRLPRRSFGFCRQIAGAEGDCEE